MRFPSRIPDAIPPDLIDQAKACKPELIQLQSEPIPPQPGARVLVVSTGEQGRVVEVWGADDPGTVTDPEYVGRVLVRLDGREYDTIFRRDQVQEASQ